MSAAWHSIRGYGVGGGPAGWQWLRVVAVEDLRVVFARASGKE
jgi:hypothetical protein